jgi:hypothetical protein
MGSAFHSRTAKSKARPKWPRRFSTGCIVPALGTADAVILIDLDDVATPPGGDLPQFARIVIRIACECR